MIPLQILPQLPSGARILFVRLRSLGDVLLSTPLFAALKDWRRDLRLSVLVEEPHHEVLLGNPDLESTFVLPLTTGAVSLWMARARTLSRIRAEEFACCINLHGGTTSAWLTWLSRARYRVGLRGFRHAFCYNVRLELQAGVSSINAKRHTVEYQIEWLRALGMPAGEIPPLRVCPDAAIESQVRSMLDRHGIDFSSPYCVIQPTSKFQTKEWTAQGFAEVADYVQAQFGFRALLTGGPGEGAKLKRVAQECRRAPVILEEVSISELLWIIKQAKLFVGNDSGPTHLAAALRVPTIVVFGSSDSQVWYPWKVSHGVVQNPFSCNPCPGYRCLVYGEPKCILSITASQVIQAIERLLSNRDAQPVLS
jgi:lipopolysaccharide heptosyltransferase II